MSSLFVGVPATIQQHTSLRTSYAGLHSVEGCLRERCCLKVTYACAYAKWSRNALNTSQYYFLTLVTKQTLCGLAWLAVDEDDEQEDDDVEETSSAKAAV